MGLKLEKVLDKNINNRLLQEAIKTGDIFKDYVPAIVFAEPQPTKFKISDKGDICRAPAGALQISTTSIKRLQ